MSYKREKAFYLHIGNNYSVDVREIIGIFDMDNTTVTSCTKKLLDRAEKEKRLFLATYELPKTFIITKKRVYLSQLTAATLKKRLAASRRGHGSRRVAPAGSSRHNNSETKILSANEKK